MTRNSAARAVLDCLDIAGVIVSFLHPHELLPVLLSDHRLRDAVRRILGPDRSLTSDHRLFTTSVPLVQWAMGMGCRTEGLCTSAALSGSMHVLKWLREENNPPCPWDEDTCTYAGLGGHLHVLKWLREENNPPCPWNARTCACAAIGGHVHVLKWLREENNPPCPWNTFTCSLAARYGQLHVLKWLREENDPPCPWNRDKCISASSDEGHLHAHQWLQEQHP
jgi:hypothetical protein